jgi:subtilase family serine protease
MTTRKLKKKFTNKLKKNEINKFTNKIYNNLANSLKNIKKKNKKLHKAKGNTRNDIEELLARKLDETSIKTNDYEFNESGLIDKIMSNLPSKAIKDVDIQMQRKLLIEKYKKTLKQNKPEIKKLEKQIKKKEKELNEKKNLNKKSPPRTRARQKITIVSIVPNLNEEIKELTSSISADERKLYLLKNPIDLKVEIEMFNMRYRDFEINTDKI